MEGHTVENNTRIKHYYKYLGAAVQNYPRFACEGKLYLHIQGNK